VENFEIILEIQELTNKQRIQNEYLIQHKWLTEEANHFREALYRVLNNKLDFSLIEHKEGLIIKYKKSSEYRIVYNSIKDKEIKSQIRRVIESSLPIYF
jgi:hypothetical protein